MCRPAIFQRLAVDSQMSSPTPCLTNSSHFSSPKTLILPPQFGKTATLCLDATSLSWGLEITLRTLIGPCGTLSGDSWMRQQMLGNRSKAPCRIWSCLCFLSYDSQNSRKIKLGGRWPKASLTFFSMALFEPVEKLRPQEGKGLVQQP